MQYSFKKVNIEAPFPTTQCGHSSQVDLIYEFKDHLFARIISFKDDNNWIFHISLDMLCFTLESRNTIQAKLREYFNNEKIVVITSATHTHYANSARNPEYVTYVNDLLFENMKTMEYEEKGLITSSFQKVHHTTTGKSRISGYETNLEYLCLLRFYSENDNFLTVVINNCHPTTLQANVPYFSSEYPGYVLNKLEKTYPNTSFSFIMGASGDISSRFVRSGQDYEAMSLIGDNLYKLVLDELNKQVEKKQLTLSYKEVDLPYCHEFAPIDISNISEGLSERELETIKIGQTMRENMKTKPSLIFGKLPDSIKVGAWSLGSIKIVFYPNEIFSEYMNYLDDDSYLVSYSNGYGPYILPVDFKHVTYEMFIDTLTKDTKLRLIELLKNI